LTPPEVVISLDDVKLRAFFVSCHRKFHYVYFGEQNKEILGLLKERYFQELQLEKTEDADKREISKSYVELVGSLGRRYGSVFWWANFLSSKNHAISRLLPNLCLLNSLVSTLSKNPTKDILFINPPAEIRSCLVKYCQQNFINWKVFHNRLGTVASMLKSTCQTVAYPILFVYSNWKCIYLSRKYLRDESRRGRVKGKYYVLRSWFYPASIDNSGKYVDSFFGALPDYLNRQGVKLLVVAGILGDYESITKKIGGQREFLIVTQEYFLKYSDPIKAVIDTFNHRVRVRDVIYFGDLDVTDIVKQEIDRLNRYSVMTEYLYSYFVRGLLNRISIATFTTTYENNPWERVCFWALRKYSSKTKIIGYQHSVLSQAHVKMLLSKEERDVVPMPDKVITIGKVTRDILVNRGNYDPEMVKEGCGLRFAHIFKLRGRARRKTYNILVTPEGMLNESVNMFDFVHRALSEYGKYKIILRPHPALPFSRIKAHLSFDINSDPNFMISNNAHSKDDLNEADVVIYRGSALSLEALKMGIPVIYISLKDDILSVDPMYECAYLKWSVKNEQELRDALQQIYNMSEKDYQTNMVKASNYLKDYVYEITEERLKEFIS